MAEKKVLEILNNGNITKAFPDFDFATFKKIYEEKNDTIYTNISGLNNRCLALPLDSFNNLKLRGDIETLYSLWRNKGFTSGLMTIPFKLRPKKGDHNFTMTTDITLGAYLGYQFRISRRKDYYFVIPATLGLSYINVENNETTNTNTENNSSLRPGWTWSTGFIFDFSGFNLGFVLGRDYVSEIGNDWFYHDHTWYSFSIGYSFFSKKSKGD